MSTEAERPRIDRTENAGNMAENILRGPNREAATPAQLVERLLKGSPITTNELNPMQITNLKNIAKTSFMATVVGIACFPIWGFADSQADEKISGPMKGLFWRVDWSYMKEKRTDGAYLEDMKKNLSSNSCLGGIFIGFGWNDIEPKPGEYNWKFVDSVVELARRYGKPYKLSVKAGIRTPEWVYNEGAQIFSYKKTRGARGWIKNPKESHIPIPWDPIYLKYFKKFIEQMGERYSGDYNCIAVTISGINSRSAEMHLPKGPEDIREWERLGDYKGKIVEATGKLTDIFADSFPRQQLCVHLAMPIKGMNTELKSILDYGVKKYPERFTAQDCQLSGKSDQSQSVIYQLIHDVKDKVHHGFQNVAGWTGGGLRDQGSLEMTVLNYIGVDAEYLEVAYDDGMNQDFCRRWVDEVAKAKQMGYEEYKASLIQNGKYVDGHRVKKALRQRRRRQFPQFQ